MSNVEAWSIAAVDGIRNAIRLVVNVRVQTKAGD